MKNLPDEANKAGYLLVLGSLIMANKPGALYYTTLVMTILYFLVGVFFIVAPQAIDMFPGYRHTLIGVLFIVYGVIRIFRLKKIRQSTYDQENNN